MFPYLVISCLALLPGQEPAVHTQLKQVAPLVPADQPVSRSRDQIRAVVLIQEWGKNKKDESEWHGYQLADSPLVKRLASQADVFALGYEQTTAVSEVAGSSAFREHIRLLRERGYTEIVLVGFASGGLVARQFVEDEPNSGVTKVIQVGSPNQGLRVVSGKDVFHQSLTRQARHEFFKPRVLEKRIPEAVQFVCVVDTGWVENSGLGRGEEWTVSTQWPADLQKQGIPLRVLTTKYMWSSFSEAGASLIAELIKDELPRWKPKEVQAMKKELMHLIDRPDGV
jgi:hypothetical protein